MQRKKETTERHTQVMSLQKISLWPTHWLFFKALEGLKLIFLTCCIAGRLAVCRVDTQSDYQVPAHIEKKPT